jgi:hypothetical protein
VVFMEGVQLCSKSLRCRAQRTDPDRLERLGRYEVHLDRKLERMLTMLLRLKELRCTAVEG